LEILGYKIHHWKSEYRSLFCFLIFQSKLLANLIRLVFLRSICKGLSACIPICIPLVILARLSEL